MPINNVEELFKRLNDPDAGYKAIEELEQRDRQRWERNALRLPKVVRVKQLPDTTGWRSSCTTIHHSFQFKQHFVVLQI